MAKGAFSTLSLLFCTTDEQAMLRVQAEDDHRAFAQLVGRWEEPIRRLCTRMVGDPHRGEDLKQETFAKLFARRKSYQATGRFSTFLWRVALNVCYDELRRVKRRGESALDEETAEAFGVLEGGMDFADPHTEAAEQEEAELVRTALMRLPEMYRTVLVLRHYEGLKLQKIAEILEIPLGTVNSRLAEGLVRLTRLLEPSFREQRNAFEKSPPRRQENLVL
ncbi:MAG: sigma-70 family RNA polymerase sigma factor [Verrucomicrobia subdivision 3 bacterium]|nr:sigma-70 family RNA polymerase sigma factor [Limisphaerales bacterium]